MKRVVLAGGFSFYNVQCIVYLGNVYYKKFINEVKKGV